MPTSARFLLIFFLSLSLPACGKSDEGDGDADADTDTGSDTGQPECPWGPCADGCGARTCCGDCCSDMDFDPLNCGGCGTECDLAAGEQCFNGSCTTCAATGACPDACSAGFGCCDMESTCCSPLDTEENCGACGTSCGAGEICDFASRACQPK